MPSVFETVKAVEGDLNRILLERQGAVQNALLALLTRQHYLQISRQPGTAKTFLANAVVARITGARVFTTAFYPGSTADDLLGPQDLLALADEGKHVRRHARSLVEADVGFIDEIGRGNDLVYPILLPLLDENRTVNELGMDAPLTIALASLFAASNSHLAGNRNLEALNNRFLLRDEILPLQERASRSVLLVKRPRWQDVQAQMSLDELRQAQGEAQHVAMTGEVGNAVLDLQEGLLAEGIVVTDRMLAWSGPLLRAHAWLQGATTVMLEDLGALASAWWEDPKDRLLVQRAILSVSNPLDLRALELEDNAMDALKHLPSADAKGYMDAVDSTNAQLVDICETLKMAIRQSRARDKRRATQSFAKIYTAQKHLADLMSARIGRVSVGPIDIEAELAA